MLAATSAGYISIDNSQNQDCVAKEESEALWEDAILSAASKELIQLCVLAARTVSFNPTAQPRNANSTASRLMRPDTRTMSTTNTRLHKTNLVAPSCLANSANEPAVTTIRRTSSVRSYKPMPSLRGSLLTPALLRTDQRFCRNKFDLADAISGMAEAGISAVRTPNGSLRLKDQVATF